MDRFLKERNQKLAQKIIKSLEKRHFNAFYCNDKHEALEKALSLISKEETISWGGSVSVQQIGLINYLEENGYKTINRDKGKSPQEKELLTRQGLLSDVFLMSTNALSEDGYLVNVDGTGNRVAALCYGPKKIIIIVGMNKITKTLDDAIVRARSFAAPVNMQRINSIQQRQTPCVLDGSCADCVSQDSICSQIVVTRLCKPVGKINIILINEDLGF